MKADQGIHCKGIDVIHLETVCNRRPFQCFINRPRVQEWARFLASDSGIIRNSVGYPLRLALDVCSSTQSRPVRCLPGV